MTRPTRPTRAALGTLPALVAAAGPDLVRRSAAGFADDAVALPLRLDAALDLGDGRVVAVVSDAVGARWTTPLVAGQDAVRRAVAGDGVAQALVGLLADRSAQDTLRDSGFRVSAWYVEETTGERAVAVDQTNESVVVGERAVVKWNLRQPAAGSDVRHPAPGRLATLAATGFTGTPRPWGALTLTPPGAAEPLLLATVAELLPGALDGWEWAVDDVRALARGDLDLAGALAPAAALGDLVARMHLALATGGRDRLTAEEAQRWATTARADLDEALAVVDGPEGARLAARAPRIAAGLAPLRDAAGTPTIDGHGDLHVGQVLRYRPVTTEDPADPSAVAYAVVDFDGNPVVPPADRARRRPAAVDVAGMLAALDHVGRVVVKRTEGIDAGVVEHWIPLAEKAFLDAYREVLASAGHPDLLDERLLRPVRLQQECREFHYAVRHLPHWRYVPDGALGPLLGEGPTP